jgi:hypothetical protein
MSLLPFLLALQEKEQVVTECDHLWSLGIFRVAQSRKDEITEPRIARGNPEGIGSLSPGLRAAPGADWPFCTPRSVSSLDAGASRLNRTRCHAVRATGCISPLWTPTRTTAYLSVITPAYRTCFSTAALGRFHFF